MKNLLLALIFCLSTNLFAQEINFSVIKNGEMVLKNNETIRFSSLEEQGDKIYFFNLSSQQKEHVYKSSIKSIDGVQLIPSNGVGKQNSLEQTSKQIKKLEYINSRNILLDGKKLSKGELIHLLESKPFALNQYKSGVSQKTVGSFLIGFGAGLFVGNGITNLSMSGDEERKNPTILFFIGGGLAASGIVLKITGANSIKNSISTYNKENLAYNKSNLDFKFLVSNNGAGLRLNF